MEKHLNIALAGNPNVGKSTVFNALTGMKQHTGNWTGKTVATARGKCISGETEITLTDLPGTYSLMAHSAEEQVARDYICFSGSDGVVIVCDGSCLERNLNLVLQILEITPHAVVVVNLLDEAAKKKITVDLGLLEERLGVPVCGTAARSGRGLEELLSQMEHIGENSLAAPPVVYSEPIEQAIALLVPPLEGLLRGKLSARFAALRILERCDDLIQTIDANTCGELSAALSDNDSDIGSACIMAEKLLSENGIDRAALRDMAVREVISKGEVIAGECVSYGLPDCYERDRKIDRVLTHRIWGLPVMLLMLMVIFFITVKGANYPSELLSSAFSALGERLRGALTDINTPQWLIGMTVDGIYCVLSWVVSVMLPPMAIFFPMFTLLEDVGYLPRAAFNLDRFFSRADACGKQALTMSMGLGCNAVGITGCRIIDSPRERLIAILTNAFMPCNGRFPTLIMLSAAFFAVGAAGSETAVSAVMLTAIIILGMAVTLIVSKFLSKTLLRGEKTSFALELPPYRCPQVGKVIVRSLLDRTVFVLGRAVTAAAPAGFIIWLMNTLSVNGKTLLAACSELLDPFGHFFGMDGAIILAFILGFPANEIVLPILLMIYTGASTPAQPGAAASLHTLLSDNGWTWATALCTMIFMLCHFPCATSCMTVKKETGSLKWTLAAMVIPTAVGLILCKAVSLAAGFFL